MTLASSTANASRRSGKRNRKMKAVSSRSTAILLVAAILGFVVRFEAPVVALALADGNGNDIDDFACGVYVAPSTLPGTGLGMYAGSKGYRAGEMITKTLGDHIVAIPDSKETHSDTGLYDKSSEDMTKYFLWDQYTWNPRAFGINVQHVATRDNEIASPGFGAAANSFMDFVNVEEGGCEFGLLPPEKNNNKKKKKDDNAEEKEDPRVHRSRDPGAGAFTPFHSRKAWAGVDIAPHSEFFVSYGDDWFLDRQWRLGTIPVSGDHQHVEDLWRTFHGRLFGSSPEEGVKRSDDDDDDDEKERHAIYREFWSTFVANGQDIWPDSRIFSAMPGPDDADDVYDRILESSKAEGTYVDAKREKMRRSPEWLAEHGICADSVRIGRSTLPGEQAGHGAFARTRFVEGEAVMAAPLIHIPDRAVLDTFFQHDKMVEHVEEQEEMDRFHPPYYDDDDDDDDDDEDEAFDDANDRVLEKYTLPIGFAKTGHQLLLNYVFGHPDSTMALSPYGPGVQLINHNQTMANVRLDWAQPHRSNHHAELLEESVEHIRKNYPMGSVLGMEVIAIRTIEPGEELFLDYGDEWEAAWRNHVETWTPPEGSEGYVSAIDLNTRPEHVRKPLPNTYRGQLFRERDPETGARKTGPFPPNVRLMMNAAWRNHTLRDLGEDLITDALMWEDYDYDPVEVIYKTGTVDNPYKYEFEDKEIFDSLDEEDREEVIDGYRRYEAKILKKREEALSRGLDDENDDEDRTLYTVVVRTRIEEHDPETLRERSGRPLPTYDRETIEEVPRRGLKFEDLSYTQDQFLPGAFREYIRIPDEIFPEAWRNLRTLLDKKRHYWRYRNPSDPTSRGRAFEIQAGSGDVVGSRSGSDENEDNENENDEDDDMFVDDDKGKNDENDEDELELDLDDVSFFFADKYVENFGEDENAYGGDGGEEDYFFAEERPYAATNADEEEDLPAPWEEEEEEKPRRDRRSRRRRTRTPPPDEFEKDD